MYIDELLKLFEKAKKYKEPITPLFDKITALVCPFRDSFNSLLSPDKSYQTSKLASVSSKKRADRQFSSEASLDAQLLVSYLLNRLTPYNQKWVKMVFTGDYSTLSFEGKQSLERLEDYIFSQNISIHSGAALANSEAISDSVYYGTSGVFSYYDEEEDSIIDCPATLKGSYYLEGKGGLIDYEFFIEDLTAGEIADKYGKDKLKANLIVEYNNNSENTHQILIAYVPTKWSKKVGGAFSEGFDYVGYVVSLEHKEVLDTQFYYVNPVTAFRLNKLSGSVWGFTPTFTALTDIEGLNARVRDYYKQSRLVGEPIFIGSEDFPLNQFNLEPNSFMIGLNEDGSRMIDTLKINPDLNALMAMINRLTNSIRQAFLVDTIGSQSVQPISASQYNSEKQKEDIVFSPMVARLVTEYLDRWIRNKCILALKHKLVVISDELFDKKGLKIKFDYVSPLISLVKSGELIALERFFQSAGPLLQASPDSADAIDFDKFIEYEADQAGVPKRLFRSEEDIAALRKARAAAQQQQQLQQTIANNTNTLNNLKK